MTLPKQFSLGIYHGDIGVEEIQAGRAKWRPLIIHALESYNMTSDELIRHLLSECYDNIDHELNFVLLALDDLRELGALRISRIVFNRENNRTETYLTVRFFSDSKVY